MLRQEEPISLADLSSQLGYDPSEIASTLSSLKTLHESGDIEALKRQQRRGKQQKQQGRERRGRSPMRSPRRREREEENRNSNRRALAEREAQVKVKKQRKGQGPIITATKSTPDSERRTPPSRRKAKKPTWR